MSVSSLGESLLGEVKEEGFDSLLRSLQASLASKTPRLVIKPLNRALEAFLDPPETQQQRQVHPQWSTQHQTPQPEREKPPAVIEITGASACSGKTQLLYYLVAGALMPSVYKDVSIQGRGQAVVLLDLSSRFTILRLRDVMSSYGTVPKLPEQDVRSIISDSLSHLHIFRPQSSVSLLATLDVIPEYLLAKPSTHFSANRTLGLLAINDLSSFYWQDRQDADDETSTSTAQIPENANTTPYIQRYRDLVTSLRNIHNTFSCTIIATNWSLSPITTVSGQPALRPHLPGIWNSFCTLKIVIERDKVLRFGPRLSVEEAVGERAQRWEAVEQSGFSAWINWWDSGGWREEVKDAVRALDRTGRFSLRVNDSGVFMIGDGG